jgi:hypothetical protein
MNHLTLQPLLFSLLIACASCQNPTPDNGKFFWWLDATSTKEAEKISPPETTSTESESGEFIPDLPLDLPEEGISNENSETESSQ